LLLGGAERHGGLDLHHVARAVVGDHGERRAGPAVDFERDRALKTDLVAGVGGAQFAFERGIARLPHPVADLHAAKIDVAVPEPQHGLAPVGLDLVNAAAFLTVLGPAGVEHHAVAGFERRDEAKLHGLAVDARHFAQQHAALGAEAAVDERLVVGATKPAGVESAGKGHLQLVLGLKRDTSWESGERKAEAERPETMRVPCPGSSAPDSRLRKSHPTPAGKRG
jgi:hypothetical protein